jgi:beta-phosphoglucomutase-like phosphatase (HAD superfamily)
MDGLMLDTEPLYRSAWKKAAAECGFQLSDEIYAHIVGRTAADAEAELANAFGSGFVLSGFRVARDKFEAVEFPGPLPKKPGLDGILDLLESRHIPKAVATSTKRQRALKQLEAIGLLRRFSAVAAGDEVATGKPAPDIFLLAAQRLGVQSAACLVLEDAEAGIAAANRAGMQVYLVPDLNTPPLNPVSSATAKFASLSDVTRHLESELPPAAPGT